MAINKLVAGAKGAVGNSTGAEIADTVNSLIDLSEYNQIDADNYGLIADDEAKDNSPSLVSLCESAEDYSVIRFGKGKTYHFLTSTLINLDGKNLFFDLNGATLLYHDQDSIGLQIHGGWSSIQEFTSLDGLVVSGIPDTSLIKPREMVRLTSDEVALDSRGTAAYQAEDIFVEKIIDENSIQLGNISNSLTGPNVPYLTNPRISQRTGATTSIFGGIIKHRDDVTGLSKLTAPLTRLVALYNPLVYNLKVTRAYRRSIELVACLWADVRNCEFSNIDNTDKEGDQDVFGYGVSDCSLGTTVYKVVGKRVRHLVDTHCQTYGSSFNNPELYGSSTGMTVNNCLAINTTGDSFGAHHQSRGISYNNCISMYSEAFGFQIRGDVTLNNCTSMYCQEDINIFDEDNFSPSRTRAVINNHTSHYSGPITNSNKGVAVHFNNYTGNKVISAGSAGFYKSGQDDAVVHFGGKSNVTFSEPSNSFNAYFGNNIAGTIFFDELTLTFDNYETKNYRGLDIRGEGSSHNFKLIGDKLRVKGTGVDILFRSSTSQPIVDGQMIFNLVLDEGVGVWGDQPQANDTNILICGGGDLNIVRNVNYVTEREYRLSGRTESITVDFGSLVSSDELVTGTVSIEGLYSLSDYDIKISFDDVDILPVSAKVTSDEVVTITAINKGVSDRDMQSISGKLILNCI